jgi:hypothetical protein
MFLTVCFALRSKLKKKGDGKEPSILISYQHTASLFSLALASSAVSTVALKKEGSLLLAQSSCTVPTAHDACAATPNAISFSLEGRKKWHSEVASKALRVGQLRLDMLPRRRKIIRK